MFRYFRFIIVFLLLSIWFIPANAQPEQKQYSLEKVIQRAQLHSPDALLAKHRFRNSYWQYRTFKATNLPRLSLDATLPDFNRSIANITQPDGSVSFRSQFQANSSAYLSLAQNIGLTGGQVFMNSGLQRIDLLGGSKSTSYLASPLYIGISQPIWGFNAYKWSKRIEPIKYQEAKSVYLEDMERLSIRATALFFDLLLAQISYEIASNNQANNDTIYKITKGRYNLGKIAENELLQMELRLLNSNNELEQSKLQVEITTFALKSFLGIKNDERFKLIPPIDCKRFTVDYKLALSEALENRSEAISFDRRVYEAQSELEKVKADNRLSVDVYAVYGLTQSGPDIETTYRNPEDQQKLMVGLQLPILDWGLAKGRSKMAESNMELIQTRVDQDRIDFEKELYLKVMQFNMQMTQLLIASKADTIGQKRFKVSKHRYLIGKIDITDLNLAQEEKDMARKNYISTLRLYWDSYFEIRRLTLFDFLKNERIDVDYSLLY
ncbi:MAG: TolC family protein [Bacteroidetes bacterium]|nr:TolC family protein [Bacteroidota bacterium]MBT4968629.1 TolC family protein [Bacteroidota bacterium]MBT5989709.1 TolC family protein [Bacteroidota bacterium]